MAGFARFEPSASTEGGSESLFLLARPETRHRGQRRSGFIYCQRSDIENGAKTEKVENRTISLICGI